MPSVTDKTKVTLDGDPVDEKGKAADPDVQVMMDHIEHAHKHGLKAGHRYALHLHNLPQPLVGRLIGTNALGVLFHTDGSRSHGFHPWSAVQGLVAEPEEE